MSEIKRTWLKDIWEEWEILANDASYWLPLWLIPAAKTGENAKDKGKDEVKSE